MAVTKKVEPTVESTTEAEAGEQTEGVDTSPRPAKTSAKWWVVVIFAWAVIAAGFVSLLVPLFVGDTPEWLVWFGIVALIGGGIVSIVAGVLSGDAREDARSERFQRNVQATIEQVDTSEPTMKNLLLINRNEMFEYHDVTKKQARRSFLNSMVAMWVGFTVLAGSIIVVVIPGFLPPESQLTIAALGSVGVIVSGYVARTFLRQHALSLQQLNSFFNQPLVSSYLLTAERLALQLKEPDKTTALKEVLAQALAASRGNVAGEPVGKR